jgi:sulfur carrier protein
MNVLVNGEDREISPDARVSDLVLSFGLNTDRPGIAVAVNDEVVPRSKWSECVLKEGDAIELIHATQGG